MTRCLARWAIPPATWAPAEIDGLTIAGGFSFLDSEVTEVLVPTNDVLLGSDLAFAPGYQGNLRARYEWDLNQEIGDKGFLVTSTEELFQWARTGSLWWAPSLVIVARRMEHLPHTSRPHMRPWLTMSETQNLKKRSAQDYPLLF